MEPDHKTASEPISIAGAVIEPGSRRRLELPVTVLPTQTPLSLPVEVVHGRRAGPALFLCAGIHGDELNGVEIIARVLQRLPPTRFAGTLFAVPVVNVFGFIHQSRYLPDGRDLNRHFPGSPHGSMATRLAYLFTTQIMGRCDHGIDLHTAGRHRTNLPQIRGNLYHVETRRMAEAFAAPIMIHDAPPPGSLRSAAVLRRVPVIVYEAGQSHRFDRRAIRSGELGVLRVMRVLGMVTNGRPVRATPSLLTHHRTWVRAPTSGVFRLRIHLGEVVFSGQVLGVIGDTFGKAISEIVCPCDGLVIGHTNHPLVSEGDALIHLAQEVTEAAPPEG